MIARAETVFPEPLSPTSPSVLPRSTGNSRPRGPAAAAVGRNATPRPSLRGGCRRA